MAFDVRTLNKYLSAQATDDFSRFLDKIPQNAGQKSLIAAGIIWGCVAALGLSFMIQSQKLTELRAHLASAEAVAPVIPVVTMTPVPAEQITQFAEKAKLIYPGLTVTASGNILNVQSKETSAYAQFRELLGYAVSGGNNWKVSINSLCIGRECAQNALDAGLKIEMMSIDKPAVQTPAADPAATSTES